MEKIKKLRVNPLSFADQSLLICEGKLKGPLNAKPKKSFSARYARLGRPQFCQCCRIYL